MSIILKECAAGFEIKRSELSWLLRVFGFLPPFSPWRSADWMLSWWSKAGIAGGLRSTAGAGIPILGLA
jgi:hypothetical protein